MIKTLGGSGSWGDGDKGGIAVVRVACCFPKANTSRSLRIRVSQVDHSERMGRPNIEHINRE